MNSLRIFKSFVPELRSSVTNVNYAFGASVIKLREFGGKHHKGQHGRVTVIGGSYNFHGAPAFAALGALRTGADLVNIICEPTTASSIRNVSPDLMVFPLLPSIDTLKEEGPSTNGLTSPFMGVTYEEICDLITIYAHKFPLPRNDNNVDILLGSKVSPMSMYKHIIDRLIDICTIIGVDHEGNWAGGNLIIGCGLGKDHVTLTAVTLLLRRIWSSDKGSIVIDADGLSCIADILPNKATGSSVRILTPNVNEIRRLYISLRGGIDRRTGNAKVDRDGSNIYINKYIHPNNHLKHPNTRSFPVYIDAFAFRKSPSSSVQYEDLTVVDVRMLPSIWAKDADLESVTKQEQNIMMGLSIARAMGCTVILKGPVDIVVDRDTAICVSVEGGRKRAGGQGDVLAGVSGAFGGWCVNANKKLLSGVNSTITNGANQHIHASVLAGVAATIVNRLASKRASDEHGRGLTALTVVEEISGVIDDV